MNRPRLRFLPDLESHPAFAAAQGAAEDPRITELAGLFSELVVRGQRDEESPAYELIEAAVDGSLEPVEAEMFASRLAGDPALQREFDDLVLLRRQLEQRLQTRRGPSAVGEPARRRWLGFAAAALVLAAAGVGLRLDLRRSTAVTAAARTAPEASARSAEVVFADSFEGGTTGHWSN